MNIIKNQKGFLMPMTIIIMAVLVILSTAALQFTTTEVLHGKIEEQSKQAYYLARTGAEAAISAWLQKGATDKPVGEMDTVYYDAENNKFQLDMPGVSGGYFDVEIKEPDDEADYWRIISTATVGNHSRTVTLLTYPFSNVTTWYELNDDGDGMLLAGEHENTDEDTSYLSLNKGNSFLPMLTSNDGSKFADFESTYESKTIVFANSLWIKLYWVEGLLSAVTTDPNNNTTTISAENIIFDNIELSNLPASVGQNSYKGEIILKVPDKEGVGIDGSEISGGEINKKYGRVSFSGDSVKVQNYKWERKLFGLYYVISKSGETQIKDKNNRNLAGNSYYFRNNTNLLDIKTGDLILVPDEEAIKIPALRDIKPYYWE